MDHSFRVCENKKNWTPEDKKAILTVIQKLSQLTNNDYLHEISSRVLNHKALESLLEYENGKIVLMDELS